MKERLKKRLSKLRKTIDKNSISTGTKIVEGIYFIIVLWVAASSKDKTPSSIRLFICIAIMLGLLLGYVVEKCLDIDDKAENEEDEEDDYEEEFIYNHQEDDDDYE